MKLLFQEASKAENLYRLILDNALDAFIAIDPQGNILEWSAQAEASFGWKKDEVLGRPLHDPHSRTLPRSPSGRLKHYLARVKAVLTAAHRNDGAAQGRQRNIRSS